MSTHRNSQKVPVITYHSIDDSGSVISESPANFRKQMNLLQERGYKTLSLLEMVHYIKHGREFPRNIIVITFDDGYKNNYTEAFPVLKKCQFTATIFLTTSHCEKDNNWPNQHASIPRLPLLSWDEITEMNKSGIDFGAHTMNHPNLTKVDLDIARSEIIESKKVIESQIGQSIDLFSYPFGSFNKEIQDITKTAYVGAIANIPAKLSSKSDIYALERINATGKIFKSLPFSILFFRNFDLYLILKKAFNRLSRFGKI